MKLLKILLIWLMFCLITYIVPISALIGGVSIMLYAIIISCKPFGVKW